MDLFKMSMQSVNMGINLEEIQRASDKTLGRLLDFQKYKTLKDKFNFLKNFVDDINKDKLFVCALSDIECSFLIASWMSLNKIEDEKFNFDLIINKCDQKIKTLNLLVNEVKKFPKNHNKNRAKELRINNNELKVLSFVNKRLLDFKKYLENPNDMPKYIQAYFNHFKLEISNTTVSFIPDSKLLSGTENIEEIEEEVGIHNVEVFLGKIYYIYNCIDCNFIDEQIIYFVNLMLAEKIKNKTAKEIEEIKFSMRLGKINLRYWDALEKLA